MRRSRLVRIVPFLFRRSTTGRSWCGRCLKAPSLRLHIAGSRQTFWSHRGYFLTCHHRSVSLLPIGKQGAGSNFHRRVAFVSRFVPTSR